MTDLASLWQVLRDEARQQQLLCPLLSDYFHQTVLKHDLPEQAIAHVVASKLENSSLPFASVYAVTLEYYSADPRRQAAAHDDLLAIQQRDGACRFLYQAFCFNKGFHALLGYRVAHWLWQHHREPLARQFQQRIAMVLDVDIHPAAQLGAGLLLDHATGIVIGETAVVDDQVSLMQGVTLGGTGKESGDRHPKIRCGALISVGATVLGNIEIGAGAHVAAGSVVLKSVAAHTTVAGVPAHTVGKTSSDAPALRMDHRL